MKTPRTGTAVIAPLRQGEAPFAFALVTVVLAIVCVIGYAIWMDRERTLDHTRAEARNRATALAAQVDSVVDKTDLSLQMVTRVVRETGFPSGADGAKLEALLDALQTAQPELENLRVLDDRGVARYGRGVPKDAPVSFADREYFQILRDRPSAGLVVSRPYIGRFSGRWGIAVSRALTTPDGRFVGVVSAILTTASFERIGAGLELGPRGLASVRSADLTLIHGYPFSARGTQEIGSRDVSDELQALVQSGRPAFDYLSVRADGVARQASVRRVGDYPLLVVVGLSVDDALADWRSRTWLSVGLTSVGLGAIALMARWLVRSSEELRSAEALWRFALQGSAQGVWDWDIPGQDAFFSDRSRELLGLEDAPSRIDLTTWWTRVHPDDMDALRRDIDAHLKGQAPRLAREFRIRHPDGSEGWILSRGMVVERDARGHPTRMIGTHTDITPRKTAEAELRDSQRQVTLLNEQLARRAVDAETATRAKDAFLRNVTHELRTPLHQIQGALDILGREVQGERPRKWLDLASGSARKLQLQIDQTLHAAAAGAGALMLESVPFSPRRVMEEVGQLMTTAARAKGLTLQVDPAADAPDSLLGDPVRVAQALLNYLDNAIKFTPKGHVTLRSRVEEADAEGVRLRFEVSDTGIGIAEADRGKLFSPFTQVDQSLTRPYGGLGIGLSNTREIVTLMGGQFGFDSTPGQGSTFWFSARFARTPAVPGPAPEAGDAGGVSA